MSSHPINEMMGTTIEKIKEMIDADTIIGDAIYDKDGVTIIPVSKVAYGFASGGSDFPSKATNRELFGGGGGAGVTITPIAFIVITNGDVRLMHVATADSTADRALNLVPELVDKISSMVANKKKKKDGSDSSENEVTPA